MRTKLFMVTLGAGLVLAAMPAVAHHSFAAEFDASKPVTLRGTVTKMEWINPHVWIHIDVNDRDGKITSWMVEGGAPSAMLRRGFTKNSLPAGVEIVVKGYQARNGWPRANGQELTYAANGKKIFLSSIGTGAPGDPSPQR